MFHYIEKINRKERFGLARYGDGEFQIMMGVDGQNRDGVVYTKKLRQALMHTIQDPKDYDYGIVMIARYMIGTKPLEMWIRRNASPDINWVDGTEFKNASFNQKIEPLINALRRVRMLYIGSHRLTNAMYRLFPGTDTIECSIDDAFGEVDLLRRAVLHRVKEDQPDIVGFSCGPAAKVLIHSLWDHTPDISLIDFGSLWDGYLGWSSRTYMTSPRFKNYVVRVLDKYVEN